MNINELLQLLEVGSKMREKLGLENNYFIRGTADYVNTPFELVIKHFLNIEFRRINAITIERQTGTTTITESPLIIYCTVLRYVGLRNRYSLLEIR